MTHPKVQIVLMLDLQSDPEVTRSMGKGKRYSVLLMQTNKKRGEFWQNITGSVEKIDSEKSQGSQELTWLMAAKRELFEETKLDLNLAQFIDLNIEAKFTDARGRNVVEKCFLAVHPGPRPNIVIDPKEHQAYRWVMSNEVQKNFYKFPSNYECFLKSLEMLGLEPCDHQIIHAEEE